MRRYHWPSTLGAITIPRRQSVPAVGTCPGYLPFCHERVPGRRAVRESRGPYAFAHIRRSLRKSRPGVTCSRIISSRAAPLRLNLDGGREERRVALEVAEILIVDAAVDLLLDLFYLELAHLAGNPDAVPLVYLFDSSFRDSR